MEPNVGNLGAELLVVVPLDKDEEDDVDGATLENIDDEADDDDNDVEEPLIEETSFLVLFINDIPLILLPFLKVALGPNSFDIFSNAPAAAWIGVSLLVLLLFGSVLTDEEDEVVDNNKGEVILCKPGANWVGVEEG